MNNQYTTPSLFGLSNSNRDFTHADAWGKNQFNSAFPTALCCYLAHKGLKANYLVSNGSEIYCDVLAINEAFGIDLHSPDIYFSFETPYTPYQPLVVGSLPRVDLVIQNRKTGNCIAGFEIKLTALPDNTTHDRMESEYGSELVVRPDTIVYLACSLAHKKNANDCFNQVLHPLFIHQWDDANEVKNHLGQIIFSLQSLVESLSAGKQTPFLIQPIWKTKGKSPVLSEYCLDVFIWSDIAFLKFILDISSKEANTNANLTRQQRTLIWLYKMLLDYCQQGRFNHTEIIDRLSYNTKNDKAFAVSGNITNRYMACQRLTQPIIGKSEIKNIILGGGQNLLSPERRFDAIVFSSPELFA